MANGNGNKQKQGPQITDDQMRAMLTMASANKNNIDWSKMPQWAIDRQRDLANFSGSGIASTDPSQTGGVSMGQLANVLQAFQPPPQPQQQQQPQTPSLSQMWNAYNQQGQQQALGQQPTQTQPLNPVVSQAMTQPALTPVATVSNMPSAQSPFAPPPPPAPGQPQRLQQGGFVQDQNQPQQQQLYIAGQAPGNVISNLYPRYGTSAVGAAAMGGMPMFINPEPNMGTMSKGGVYTGPQLPTVYGTQQSSAPGAAPGSLGQYTFPGGGQLTQDQMARFMGGTPDEQATVAAALGTTPGAILQAASNYRGGAQGAIGAQGGAAMGGWSVPNAQPQYVSSSANMPAGPWNVRPGVFNAAPMPTPTIANMPGIQPVLPANAAMARPGGTGVAWATPPMPGQTPMPPSNVGAPTPMQLSSPVPGLPPAAPSQGGGGGGVQMTGATGSGFATTHNWALANAGMALYTHMTGGDPSSASPADIANFHSQLATAVGGVTKKMNSGGLVPGRGNTDSVLALLTPGEYVVPKNQVPQLFGGRTPAGMQGGGFVPDNEAPEVRRGTLTVPTPPNQPTQPNQPTAQPSSSPSSSSQAAPSGNQIDWNAIAAQRQQANIGSGGPGSIDKLGTLGDEPIIGEMGLGGGGAGAAGGISNAIGGLMSGLAQAAQTYANSIKPWQPQRSAIPNPEPAPQVPQFKEEQVQQPPQHNPATLASYSNYFLNA